MEIVQRKLKQLFNINIKPLKSRPTSSSTFVPMMSDGEDKKDRRPLEPQLMTQQEAFELSSPCTAKEDAGYELPTNGVERQCELEEELIWLRMRLQRLGEEFSSTVSGSLHQIMKTELEEYENKFRKNVQQTLKSQIRCKFLEDELRKTTENLYDCEGKLEVEKTHVLELKQLVTYVKACLAQELENQTCGMCNAQVRNVIIFPCMHFLYCEECLHGYRRRNKRCPACQAHITAVVNLGTAWPAEANHSVIIG
ncbi:hypothetical protein R1sor_008349 [Riccia sorocarpa]|uniref:RING-type domain-containing protein n=1 Tax=Riccia sorocarpa TaxID=122646 RepID=A0ABD3HT45_9MARC